jgi:hypothetical protein
MVVAAALPKAAAARAEVVAAVRLAQPLRQQRRVPVLLPAAAAVQPQPPHRPCNQRRIRAPTTRQPRDPSAVRPEGDLSGTRKNSSTFKASAGARGAATLHAFRSLVRVRVHGVEAGRGSFRARR